MTSVTSLLKSKIEGTVFWKSIWSEPTRTQWKKFSVEREAWCWRLKSAWLASNICLVHLGTTHYLKGYTGTTLIVICTQVCQYAVCHDIRSQNKIFYFDPDRQPLMFLKKKRFT